MADSLFEPPDWLQREEEVLASYAMHTRASRGRKHPEPPHAFRTLYQRDRDRIVHSTAFRRLMHKTQVLVNPGGDYHRTRLTHTLEVAQIARTIARQLGLNEDLTEAIALMHDLGHPPFGHAGEIALDECMSGNGGFEHNRHGLRIVELLEYRYPDFPGVNLSYEVLQAQAMHSKRPDAAEVRPYLDGRQPLLEAQVVDAADSLAYTCHDVDDALTAALVAVDDLADVPLFKQVAAEVRARHASIGREQFQPAVVRAMINRQVSDLLEQTRQNLRRMRIKTVEDVRACSTMTVDFGQEVRELRAGLGSFLGERVYRHYRVLRMAHKGQRIVRQLFEEFCRHPEQLPDRQRRRAAEGPVPQAVCDYLAGMTDRYAQDEHLRLFQPHTLV